MDLMLHTATRLNCAPGPIGVPGVNECRISLLGRVLPLV
ncbi:hypothetical protein BLL52_0503 [Rhodoferax antarcticus ANT.BR]|uniref:Uncharacterized protein n=1 Tax=Rhodoferax antarcticus ANT.BR TaxID=1111071 RepID=A0A1Q8YJS0_9BURK|nr:hypothetical protein BLL52_0503 [Rhodoferax antarcticus ANT.BR]